jgi:hypothetical protein
MDSLYNALTIFFLPYLVTVSAEAAFYPMSSGFLTVTTSPFGLLTRFTIVAFARRRNGKRPTRL